ncbi:hypothetical protein [Mucilaginibacter panaciglaebae]|uniref:Uncharacterized protein n=1 Tax=Mucilaginibacter panaciglaebae TaxID=502331 RepID=A0ABP7WZM8_9SPHI
MAKKEQEKQSKPRAEQYEEKVKFNGTLEQMIQMAVKPKPGNKQAK